MTTPATYICPDCGGARPFRRRFCDACCKRHKQGFTKPQGDYQSPAKPKKVRAVNDPRPPALCAECGKPCLTAEATLCIDCIHEREYPIAPDPPPEPRKRNYEAKRDRYHPELIAQAIEYANRLIIEKLKEQTRVLQH